MEFFKYEATANDFIIIDGRNSTIPIFDDHQVRSLCDRRRGIGADGVLWIAPSAELADARMIVLNADGSRPEMCGNGLRCVAAWLASQRRQTNALLKIETDAGVRICEVERTEFLHSWNVRTEMGALVVKPQFKMMWNHTEIETFHINVGNPHAVMFVSNAPYELDLMGSQLQHHGLFPQGVNVEQVVVDASDPTRVQAFVYERGVGQTYACGTGACAIAAAMITKGHISFDQMVTISMPGGLLHVCVDKHWNASLKGPARFVYRGELEI